ncbi:hypothetical protein PTXU04_00040 [Escherichia phage PTXU04]|uniref:Uncharacterized protein n=1 Tax=Escherichia phage PTXU04 TaxID=2508206 RepID=A0A482MSU9_9CAUD|nr:hypothetical protein HOV50_gp40 [Escherichia phage PTXU04]QBQ76654.1 hypothetical protein PTXU04_00040 [Escherichia phage PTXU04]
MAFTIEQKYNLIVELIRANNMPGSVYELLEADLKSVFGGAVAKGLTPVGTAGNQQSFADAADEVAEEVAQSIGQETDATTLDKNGLPWDSRIHSAAKTFNADGTWKYLRGVDREVLVPQVEAELRGEVATAEEVEAPAVAPQAPVAPQPGLPPLAGVGLPPLAPQVPVAIDFPAIADESGATDEAMEQTAAALAHKHGADALEKLYGLFGITGGKTAKDIQSGYKFTFWQYATNDDFLRSQSVI